MRIGLNRLPDKLEFARRAGGQVVTSVVCNRSQPDPLGIVLWRDKLEFDELSNSRSLRASSQTGVAIPWIDVPPLVEEFQKTAQKNGLYDDRLPEIR